MTALAIGIGVLAGLCVAVMTSVVNVAHMRIFGIPFDVHLSAAERVAPLAAFGAPMLAASAWRARPMALSQEGASLRSIPSRPRALRGGRMSLRQSLLGGDADRDLERLRALGRARGGLRQSGRASPRISA